MRTKDILLRLLSSGSQGFNALARKGIKAFSTRFYFFMNINLKIKQQVVDLLKKQKVKINIADLTTPPDPTMGDLALPCFELVKAQKKNFTKLAALRQQTKLPIITLTDAQALVIDNGREIIIS